MLLTREAFVHFYNRDIIVLGVRKDDKGTYLYAVVESHSQPDRA